MSRIQEHWYDWNKGWDATHPGWHAIDINMGTKNYHIEMIEWMYENLDNPDRHCVWTRAMSVSSFKFRYERDYIWFKLSWQ